MSELTNKINNDKRSRTEKKRSKDFGMKKMLFIQLSN